MEHWKPVLGYEGVYEVSNLGRVRSLPRPRPQPGFTPGRVLKPLRGDSPKGPNRRRTNHHFVSLSMNGKIVRRSIHRLVLEAFVGPCPKGQQGRHLNGNPSDNRWPQNIRWGTPLEDASDKYRHGTLSNAKLDKHK